jgi:hypothetical protein
MNILRVLPRPAVASLALILLQAASAQAELIQFTFSGTISAVSPSLTFPQLGDPFTVSYVFDSNTPNTSPYPPIESWYAQPKGFGMLVTVKDQTYFADGNGYYGLPGYLIRVQSDAYTVQAGPQGVNELPGDIDITILFTGYDSPPFPTTLPTSFDPSAWRNNYLAVSIADVGVFDGHIESLVVTPLNAVPEPSTLALLGIGVLVLVARRTRWSRTT